MLVNLLENNFLKIFQDIISGNTANGIPPLKWHSKYLHLITCSSIDDLEYICWYLLTFNDAHDEYFSVPAFISS